MCRKCEELKLYAIRVWHIYGRTNNKGDRLSYTLKWTMKKFPKARRTFVYDWILHFLYFQYDISGYPCFFRG